MNLNEEQLLKLGCNKKDIAIFVEIKNLEIKLLESSSVAHHLKDPTSSKNSEEVSVSQINQEEANLLNACSSKNIGFAFATIITAFREENFVPKSMLISLAIDQLGGIGHHS